MTRDELIAELMKSPNLEVCVWVEDDDDNMPVVQAVWEGGTSHIQLLTTAENWIEGPGSDSSPDVACSPEAGREKGGGT